MLDTSQTDETLLEVSNVEVIYNHVILVLKGVSLKVPKGGIALLGETVQESPQHLSQFLIYCFQSEVRLPRLCQVSWCRRCRFVSS